jgi:hypothetical protein
MPEPNFMTLGIHTMAPEPISKVYFYVSMWISLSLLGNGSVKRLPRQQIYTQQKNCWTRRFPCGPCGIEGNHPRNSCSSPVFATLLHCTHGCAFSLHWQITPFCLRCYYIMFQRYIAGTSYIYILLTRPEITETLQYIWTGSPDEILQ